MNLSKEEQLILTFSRQKLSESDIHTIHKLLSEPLDWDMIQKHADSHRLAPLIYHHLKHLPNDAVTQSPNDILTNDNDPITQLPDNVITQLPNNVIPPENLEFFRKAYYENLARNLILFQELREIPYVAVPRGP